MKQNNGHFILYPGVHSNNYNAEQRHTCISLHRLANQVITGLSMGLAQQTKLIVNNVQEEMLVSTDKGVLATLLSRLLGTALLYGQNNLIQLSAKLIGNITLVHIKTRNGGQIDAIADSIHKLQPLAESLGGCVTLSNARAEGIDLAFTFYNQ